MGISVVTAAFLRETVLASCSWQTQSNSSSAGKHHQHGQKTAEIPYMLFPVFASNLKQGSVWLRGSVYKAMDFFFQHPGPSRGSSAEDTKYFSFQRVLAFRKLHDTISRGSLDCKYFHWKWLWTTLFSLRPKFNRDLGVFGFLFLFKLISNNRLFLIFIFPTKAVQYFKIEVSKDGTWAGFFTGEGPCCPPRNPGGSAGRHTSPR